MLTGDRPTCLRGCTGRVHRHGRYCRYSIGTQETTFWVLRFYCPKCGLTISVLPEGKIPYRPVSVARVEAYCDEQAELGSGPDPPPALLEAGCLRRAWNRLKTRVSDLKEAFGQLITSVTPTMAVLWKQMRLAKGTLENILLYLAQSHKRSLLADYQCLRWPG